MSNMSLMDIVSCLIFLGLVFWKFHWLVWGTTALLFFGCGRLFLKNAITPFEWETKTPADRIVSAFWSVILILIAIQIILTLLKGNFMSLMFYGILVLIIFFGFAFFMSRRDEGLTIPDYDEGTKRDPHPYIHAFKEVKRNGGTVPKQYGDLFHSYLKAYTGGKWDMEPFLNLIQGAIWEIMHGKYAEEDRENLLNSLLELEYETIDFYFKSIFPILPWGIKLRHSIHYKTELGRTDPREFMISVPLREYRAMQYALLLKDEYHEMKDKPLAQQTLQKENDGLKQSLFAKEEEIFRLYSELAALQNRQDELKREIGKLETLKYLIPQKIVTRPKDTRIAGFESYMRMSDNTDVGVSSEMYGDGRMVVWRSDRGTFTPNKKEARFYFGDLADKDPFELYRKCVQGKKL